jgi:hypothetical protein
MNGCWNVAQNCILLYRRIVFGWTCDNTNVLKSLHARQITNLRYVGGYARVMAFSVVESVFSRVHRWLKHPPFCLAQFAAIFRDAATEIG